MTRILDELLNQTCVYWPKSTTPDRYGEYSYGTPQELACKWQNATGQTISREGNTYEISAQVYLSSEINLDGYLWLGDLVDAPSTPPTEQRIMSTQVFPDTENDETLYIASI